MAFDMVKRQVTVYHVSMLKRTSVAHAILAALTDLAEDLTISRRRIYAKTSIPYKKFSNHHVWTERKRVQTQFKNLMISGYIRDVTVGRSHHVAFTEKGFRYSLVHCVGLRKLPLPKGMRCYVSFDIPLQHRKVRDDLRAALRRFGFKKEHQSLWSSEYDHVQFFRELITKAHAGDWVKVFLGDVIAR